MADFLTVNLKNILNKSNASKPADKDTTSNSREHDKATQKNDLSKITDWGSELKKRLSDNNSLSVEAREDEYLIEDSFFKDYFNNAYPSEWDSCANQLILMGEPLKKAMKVLGFDRSKNPILGFLLTPFGVSLMKSKLLNVDTFKALYIAVSKKLVAHSEFFKSNTYNILYCEDLWKKSLPEIVKYLELQKKILSPTAGSYSKELLNSNKEFFMASDGTLNSLSQIKDSINSVKGTDDDLEDDGSEEAPLSAKAQQAIINKINKADPAEVLAAVQFLYMASDSNSIKKALSNDFIKNVSAVDLIKASKKIAKIMPKNKITVDVSDSIVKALFN